MKKLKDYFKGVRKQFKKIIWSPFKETIKNFMTCMIFCGFICLFFTLCNSLISLGLKILGGA